jgi:hypothetical protein
MNKWPHRAVSAAATAAGVTVALVTTVCRAEPARTLDPPPSAHDARDAKLAHATLIVTGMR